MAVGQVERAAGLARSLEEYGRMHPLASALGKAERSLALALAAQGDLGAAQAMAGRAVLDHQRAGMPLELGRSLLVSARSSGGPRATLRLGITSSKHSAISTGWVRGCGPKEQPQSSRAQPS